jgi:hypothetical protein
MLALVAADMCTLIIDTERSVWFRGDRLDRFKRSSLRSDTAQTVLGIALVVAGVMLAVLYGKPKPPEVIEKTEAAVV